MYNKRFKYTLIFSLVLFVLSFSFGYFIMDNNLNKGKKQISIENPKEIQEDVEIVKEENRISPNTFIEERTSYKACGHIISVITPAPDQMVNMTKEELSQYISSNEPNKRIISFSNVKIVLWNEKNHLCKDHYVIGEEDGKIAIFKIGESGEKILDKVFVEYPVSILRELDRQKISDGIIVDSEDELSDMLENFIS